MSPLSDYLDPQTTDAGVPLSDGSMSSDAERSRLYDILSAAAPETPAPDVYRESPRRAKANTILSSLAEIVNALEVAKGGRTAVRPGTYLGLLAERRGEQSKVDTENRNRTVIASDRAKRTAAGLRLGELDKRDARAEQQANRLAAKKDATDLAGQEYDRRRAENAPQNAADLEYKKAATKHMNTETNKLGKDTQTEGMTAAQARTLKARVESMRPAYNSARRKHAAAEKILVNLSNGLTDPATVAKAQADVDAASEDVAKYEQAMSAANLEAIGAAPAQGAPKPGSPEYYKAVTPDLWKRFTSYQKADFINHYGQPPSGVTLGTP